MVAETVAQAFYDSCAYDVCAYWGGATVQVCSALEAFADHCQTYGVDVINFRTDVFCPRKSFDYFCYVVASHLCKAVMMCVATGNLATGKSEIYLN